MISANPRCKASTKLIEPRTKLYMGRGMAKIVRARYENGVLKPLERLDLRDGEEVIVVLKSFAGFKDEIPKIIVRAEEDPIEKLSSERR